LTDQARKQTHIAIVDQLCLWTDRLDSAALCEECRFSIGQKQIKDQFTHLGPSYGPIISRLNHAEM
jgi:hypothetical protein